MTHTKKYIAECIGTFALVFFGTSSVVVNTQTGGDLGLVGISLVFGIIVMLMIYVFGNTSGAHINPAVTIALLSDKRIERNQAVNYILAQLVGACVASLSVSFVFMETQLLGQTLPSGSVLQSCLMEFILTFFLMFTILGVTSQKNPQANSLAGILIGLYIVLGVFVAGPISGGSFNPARSIAPALVSGDLSHLWIYILFPILGAVSATYLFRKL